MKKVKALLYCTKSTPYLVKDDFPYENEPIYFTHYKEPGSWGLPLNGKIVAECEVETEEIDYYFHYEPPVDIGVGVLPEFEEEGYVRRRFENYEGDFELFEKSCLSYDQLDKYLKQKDGYALHIENLEELNPPLTFEKNYIYKEPSGFKRVLKAPQNMMRVYDRFGNEYILISIQSEWLCKILNGEKTIEVRKKF